MRETGQKTNRKAFRVLCGWPLFRACVQRSAPGRAPRNQRGYTLIEVIVAFALLALALTLLLGTLSGAVRQVRWTGDAGRAALHAQSLMDTIGVGQALLPVQRNGQFDAGRYRWSLTVAPWDEPLPPSAPVVPRAPSLHRLYEVALSVEWGSAGPQERLELRTLRLAPVQPGVVQP
ncbi:MAG: prepilin-type N-terminal cleavage/methylation domain-containing protein [Lysobacter sp.]|nr:prepilin-type N-terminal cleavage/methylation domain-containing protein [Lysobacter sp.]